MINKITFQRISLALISLYLLSLIACKQTVLPKINELIDVNIRALDISYYPDSKKFVPLIKNLNGNDIDFLDLLKQSGVNTARVKIWYNPSDSNASLSQVRDLFKKINALGMQTWLDIHYSDTWADPGQQTVPITWKNLTKNQLMDSMYAYTYRICGELQPDYVQIGNEINNGILWPMGNLSNYNDFIALISKGTNAVRDASPGSLIMLHYAGLQGASAFFSKLLSHQTDFDLCTISYYPWWHGKNSDSLGIVMDNIFDLTGKKTIVAETAYPFTLAWNDYTNNIIGDSNALVDGFPASPQGQLNWVQHIRNMSSGSSKRGGFCYWGGEWFAYKGATSTNGSPWENLAIINFNNQVNPVIQAFQKK